MPYLSLDSATAVAAPVSTLGTPKNNYGKTLAALEAELSARLGGRTDIDPARLDEWINDAYVDMCSSVELPELKCSITIPTVAGQYLYMLPGNIDYTLGATLQDQADYPYDGGLPLRKIDESTFEKLPDTNQVELNQYFVYGGDLLVLYGCPSQVMNVVVRAMMNPLPLILPTDSPILARSMHEGILLLAVSKAFEALLEWDQAQLAGNAYVAWMRRRLDRRAQEKDGMIAVARGVRSIRDTYRLRQYPSRREDY